MKETPTPSFFANTWFQTGIWLLLLLPPVAYLLLVGLTLSNMPYRDDYVWYFQFIHDYDRADSLLEKAEVILSPHDQHRIAPHKFVTALVTDLAGRLPIGVLNFIGNTTLLTLWIFWIWRSRRASLPLWSLVPIGFLWFQPQHWLNPVCSALANLPVIPLICFAVYALNRPGWTAFAWAVFWTFLATFSYGNGMFLFACGALLLLLRGEPRQLVLWLGLGALAVYAYFTFGNFQFTGHAGDTRVLSKVLTGPHKVVIYAWTYLGSFVMYERTLGSSIAALIVGMLITIPFLISLRETCWPPLQALVRQRSWAAVRARPDTPRLALLRELQVLFLFVLITAATVYVFRSDMADFPNLPIADYYKIWPVFAAALSLLMLYLIWRPVPGLTATALLLSGFFWLTSYYTYTDLILNIRQSLAAEALNWHLNRKWVLYGPIGMFDNAFADRYTHDAVARDRYRVPDDDLPVLQRLLAERAPGVLPLTLTAHPSADGYWMQPVGEVPAPLVGNSQAYLVLQNPTHTYVLPILPTKNSWKRLLATRRWYDHSATVNLPESTLRRIMQPGPYDLRVVTFGPAPRVWRLPYRWNAAGDASGFVPLSSARPGS